MLYYLINWHSNPNFIKRYYRMYYLLLTPLTLQYKSFARNVALQQECFRAIHIIIAIRRAVVG